MDDEILYGEILDSHEYADYFEVRRRRMLSFIVDYIIIALLCVLAALVVGFAGLITLGLGWLLYAILVPLVAAAYLGLTMGSKARRRSVWLCFLYKFVHWMVGILMLFWLFFMGFYFGLFTRF